MTSTTGTATGAPALPRYRLCRAPRPTPAVPVLDAAQRVVVDHDRGVLHVLAGPGTGKTTTLVEAAVARVGRGVPLEHLLLVTFGRRAAAELRDRITARLDRTVREPLARTVHSYAFGVLRMAAAARGLPAPRLLAAAEQDVVLRDLIAGDLETRSSPWPPELARALTTRGFAAEVRDLLSRAVERGLDGPTLSALGARRGRADWVAAGTFLTQYQQVTALARPGAYDPAELVRAAVHTLRDDPALLAAEQARRRRLFVDEYQDTDPAQAELLALLADGADEVVVVGDPDQSIYTFRGADPHALDELLAGAPRVALASSRRSGAALLTATRRVAERLPGPAAHRRLDAGPETSDDPVGAVEVRVARSASEQAAGVAAELRRAHLDGLAWSRMAVLVRAGGPGLTPLRRALSVAGVPVAQRGVDLPLAEQPASAALLTLLEAVLRPHTLDDALAEHLVLGPVGGGDPLQLRRLRRGLAAATGVDTAGGPPDLAELVRGPAGLAVLPRQVARPVQLVADVLAAGTDAAERGGSAEDVLWAMWSATGLAARWERQSRGASSVAAAAGRQLDAVVALFEAAARFADRLPGASPLDFVESVRAEDLPVDPGPARPPGGPADAVALLTAHAAKGLEWDLVCVAGVQEGTWPDLRPRGSLLGADLLVDVLAGRDVPGASASAAQLAEERRLFYVAVSRARRRVVVSAVRGEEEQPSRFLDELLPGAVDDPAASPARGPRALSLPELVADLRAVVTDPDADPRLRADAAAQLARLADAQVAGAAPEQWWGAAPPSSADPVVAPDVVVSVSPSRVEAYLTCEVKALLEQLGARDDDAAVASLGTLVHEVAAMAPDAAPDELDRLLDQRWHRLDFGAPWLARTKRDEARRMVVKLADWVRTSRDELRLVGTERAFEVAVGNGDVVLRGSVDRLEVDARGRPVVVDLKTGSAVPGGQLDAHPQLAAYQQAVRAGAFPDLGDVPGGARLLNLKVAKAAREQVQPPLTEAEDPEWVARAVERIAAVLRGDTFRAVRNAGCDRCSVRACCPLRDEGRGVPG